MVRDSPAADLDAAVGLGRVTEQLDLEPKLEITVLPRRAQKLVARYALLQAASDDRGDFDEIPTGAIGLYTYYERLAQGLRQLMAGCRKFSLEYMSRDDLAALTTEAAAITDLRYVMDVDEGRAEEILDN